MILITDLDQTLVDSSCALKYRKARNWGMVRSLIPEFKLYGGVESALNYVVHNEVSVAVVSSSPTFYILQVLKYFNLPYDVVVGYHDTAKHKPNPEPYLRALEQLRNSSCEVLVMGDAEADILAANALKYPSILCRWGVQIEKERLCCEPSYILDRSVELKDVIKFHWHLP